MYRNRKWNNGKTIILIEPDAHVLPRIFAGGDLAIHLAKKSRGGSGSGTAGRAKQKILRPPEGGWK